MLDNKRNYFGIDSYYRTYNNEHKLAYAEFKLILYTFCVLLKDALMLEGKAYYLPYKLGVLSISKFKTKGGLKTDFHYYRKTGIMRKLTNLHSEGLIAQVRWNQNFTRFSDGCAAVFKLTAARDFARAIAKNIKENNTISKYYDW